MQILKVLGLLMEYPDELLWECKDDALALIRRVGPREAYITHMSHEIGLHAATEPTLPPGVRLAYDMLEVDIPDI